jgi:hypothetical protein
MICWAHRFNVATEGEEFTLHQQQMNYLLNCRMFSSQNEQAMQSISSCTSTESRASEPALRSFLLRNTDAIEGISPRRSDGSAVLSPLSSRYLPAISPYDNGAVASQRGTEAVLREPQESE